MPVLLLQGVAVSGSTSVAAADGPKALVYVQPQPSAPTGAQVGVVGIGFDPDQAVEIRWNGPNGQQLASATGPDFTADVTVPVAVAGLYALVVFSRDANGVMGTASSTSFLVTASEAPAEATSSTTSTPERPISAIPVAGPTPAYIWALVVFVLLTLAVVLVRGRRRQRRG